MTKLYLGTIGTPPELASLATFWEQEDQPSVLVSFYFLSKIAKVSPGRFKKIKALNTMLDSGAYTASTKNKKIDIDALINEIKIGGWNECAALDVIGDPVQSAKNAEYMNKAGVNAFPTFHFGEPWEFLIEYAKHYDKIGLGGLVPIKGSVEQDEWLGQVFNRIWPKKTHVFGVMERDCLMRYPFHSCDSTSWQANVLRFGKYSFLSGKRLQKLGGRPQSKKAMGGLETYLIPEIKSFLLFEKHIQSRWRQDFIKQGWV